MALEVCRVTGSKLTEVLTFGKQPLGNGFLLPQNFANEYFYEMSLGFSEESMMLQLIHQPSPEVMFHKEYAFFSSTSRNMELHFKNFAQSVIDSGYLQGKDPFVIELGCNDGIMLKNFADRSIRHLGIEPSKNVADKANQIGVKTVTEFFSDELSEELVELHGKADAFLAANVMCHIPDIKSVVKGIKRLLKQSGVVMFEDPYLGDIISRTSYDQIYDEHVFLFSALSVEYLFNLEGLQLIDVIPQNTHGGSMRYVLANEGVYKVSPAVEKLKQFEKAQGLNRLETFNNFRINVEKSKSQLLLLLEEISQDGKKIAGYAATSKSTTILNYCGINSSLIEYICDTTPIKQNKFSPGMHVPVRPYEFFSENPPDYAFLFAWNHLDEVMEKEQDFMNRGGKWITHVPQVRIL